MENEDVKIIQFFLGILLIILLILVVVLVTRQPVRQDSNVIITNSYNTYTTLDRQYKDGWRNVYRENDEYDEKHTWRKLDYSDWGRHLTKDGTVRKNFDEFTVYVRNEENVGGYFTVRFYFDNHYGNIDSEKITYYIPAYGGKKFVYRDIYETGHDYNYWDYEVISDSRIRI